MPLSESTYLAAALLGQGEAPAEALPYVFCGNGACRDCNLLVEGIADVPSCRVPAVAGLSLRSGEGAGDANALSRRLPELAPGEPLVADVAVVGGGEAGAEAAAASRVAGRETIWLDARDVVAEGLRPLSPVAVVEGRAYVYERRRARPLKVDSLVLATGRRDRVPAFAGAALPGVFPLELIERYVELAALPGRRFVLVGGDAERLRRLEARLAALGAAGVVAIADPRRLAAAAGRCRVRSVRLVGGETLEADVLGVSFRREPALALAKALGCRTRYDPAARLERVETSGSGATSVEGVFLARRQARR